MLYKQYKLFFPKIKLCLGIQEKTKIKEDNVYCKVRFTTLSAFIAIIMDIGIKVVMIYS